MPAIALFDMDNTLFDYDKQIREDLINLRAPEEEVTEEMIDQADIHRLAKTFPYIERRIEVIRKIPGWWRNLPRLQAGWDILEVAQRIGFCCHILTKGPRSKSRAWAEKVDCISDHLGEDFPIDIVGKDKSNRYGRVLVDDFPAYMLGWLRHRERGLGIMPKQPCNKGFGHPDVIIYDGHNLAQVEMYLQAAYKREPKQHWKELLC